jgi:curved DNA-binding protein CbpA
LNYYSLLGISPGASTNEVREAYFKLVKKYHPDRNKSPGATEKMAEINLAYEILSSDKKRKDHDLKIGIVTDDVDKGVIVRYQEEEQIGQEPSENFGKCARCNFVNNSGVFVCSMCGRTFDPRTKQDRRVHDEESEEESIQDVLSEIIRCPKCNEINIYNRGSCWQCGLHFEVHEIAHIIN